MLEAVLFDFDGTLANARAAFVLRANLLLAQYGSPPHDAATGFLPTSLTEEDICHALLSDRVTTAAALAEAVARWREICRTMREEQIAPYPGVAAAIDALWSTGMPMGIVSKTEEAALLPLVERLFPGRFGVIASSALYPPKPDPALVIRTARMLRVNPVRCAFVGDAPQDMAMAHNAGMLPIGITWGGREGALLRRAGAAAVCETPSELPELLRLYKRGLIL